MARVHGVLLPERGMATRARFIIDGDGVVRWVNQPGQPREVADSRSALALLG